MSMLHVVLFSSLFDSSPYPHDDLSDDHDARPMTTFTKKRLDDAYAENRNSCLIHKECLAHMLTRPKTLIWYNLFHVAYALRNRANRGLIISIGKLQLHLKENRYSHTSSSRGRFCSRGRKFFYSPSAENVNRTKS